MIRAEVLRRRDCTSCGCYHSEVTRAMLTTHGLSKTPEYQAWAAMKARCQNPTRPDYRHYGGRGIAVCEEWAGSFERFYADMGPRPSAGHSIDRIDNDGPYSPANCRWVTRTVQQQNKRTNIELTLNGRTMTVTEWARELSIPVTTVFHRLDRGWSPEQSLTPQS